jgi:putative zinc finger/helix-turn-helix YgiT family protein
MHMSKTKVEKSKPFPWKCPFCGERAVYGAILSHPVDIDYDGRAYHVVVKHLKTPQCKKCRGVFPDAAAHRAITRAFLRKAKLLMPEQIRKYRESLHLTQKQLAAILGIAEASVSRWETGAQIQQRSLDNLLRIVFAYPDVRHKLCENKQSKLGVTLDAAEFTPGVLA